MKLLSITVFCGLFFTFCNGYKILAIFPVPSGSHYILNTRLVNELANRGHDVTHITPYLQKNPLKNLKEIASSADIIDEHKKVLFNLEKEGIYSLAKTAWDVTYTVTENMLKSETVQEILQKKEKYDLVIMPIGLTDGLMAIAHHLEVPLVLVATMPLYPWATFFLAHPAPSSYVPNLLGTYTSCRMNFWQRLVNSFRDLFTITYHQWIMLPKHRELVKKYVPGQPDFYEFLNNASLVLINSHISTYDALPRVPNAIDIGGFHIEEPKALPKDVQKFLDEAEDGVIVFSMGSGLKSADLPTETRTQILGAFSKLKQRVLWKWETDQIPEVPDNIKLMKWLPQSDVLAHPNVKALINHGGLLSTTESLYYGKPIIGIPVFGDQKMNMAISTSHGFAITLPLPQLNEANLLTAIDRILNDPEYRINAEKRSQILRDRPMKPIDTAMYWIEYVVRHKGAPHLRYPGADLTWYQRNLLDVTVFVLVVTVLSISVTVFIFKKIIRVLWSVQGQNKKNKSD